MALELADPVAKIGNRHPIEDRDDGIANLLHDASDAALRFIGAGAPFVKTLADATHRRERTFNMADHRGEGDVLRWSIEAVTAGDAATAFDDASRLEVIEDLLKEPLGDVLLLGDRADWHNTVAMVHAKDHEGPQDVFPAYGEFHVLTTDGRLKWKGPPPLPHRLINRIRDIKIRSGSGPPGLL